MNARVVSLWRWVRVLSALRRYTPATLPQKRTWRYVPTEPARVAMTAEEMAEWMAFLGRGTRVRQSDGDDIQPGCQEIAPSGPVDHQGTTKAASSV